MAASRSSRSRTSARGSGSRRGPAPSRHRGLGVLFWVCLAAIVVAVGVAFKGQLLAGLAMAQKKPPTAPAAAEPAPAPAPVSREAPRVTVAPLTPGERGAEAGGAPAARTAAPAASTASPAPEKPAAVERPSSRKARLYFTSVDQSGRIELKSVIRTVPASDSPLKDTLENMLKGPTAQEMNLGLVSMIPVDARLRGVVVKDDTAVIDFSEGFRFNSQGLDAMDAQLRQVVYAATEFPSVHRVQIRIEGQTVRYLGTEGMRLDQPLTRDSFGKQS